MKLDDYVICLFQPLVLRVELKISGCKLQKPNFTEGQNKYIKLLTTVISRALNNGMLCFPSTERGTYNQIWTLRTIFQARLILYSITWGLCLVSSCNIQRTAIISSGNDSLRDIEGTFLLYKLRYTVLLNGLDKTMHWY